ncbi:MAG: pyruvate kinase [Myxococcales bacterium FL481]|nr:MAG: pyruvate kinase [Myxococcales bacterium FL481]
MFSNRRAKILCTLGPASHTTEIVDQLIAAGMNAVRLNCSHGDHESLARTYNLVRERSAAHGKSIAILADLQGPKIRVGAIPDPGFELRVGEPLVLSTNPEATIREGFVTVDYADLAREVEIGQRVLLDDGTLELKVVTVEGDEVHTEVVVGGRLKSRKGVNLPESKLTLPALTDKDRRDLRFVLELGVDFIALSFVRRPSDLEEARDMMREAGRPVPLIAKIEMPEAVENLREIVECADGLMVARGDLGVEMGPEEVPMVQKRAIEYCNQRGTVVITATQMLDSMIRSPTPTRAEASDVANAVLDGTDTVMLSGETATGAYPVQTVRTMDRIIRRTELAERFWRDPPKDMNLGSTTNAIANAAVASTRSWPDTKAIVTYTGSGGIARLVSEYRPKVPIYAFTPEPRTYRSLALYWGVIPVLFQPTSFDGDSIFIDIDRAIVERGLLRRDDRVVIALGWPVKAHRSVNLLKLHNVGETLPPPVTP